LGENTYKLVVFEEQDKTKKNIFSLTGSCFGDLVKKLKLLKEFWPLDFSHKISI